jgi:hypothetical protein
LSGLGEIAANAPGPSAEKNPYLSRSIAMRHPGLTLATLAFCALATSVAAQTPPVGQLAAPQPVVDRPPVDACIGAVRGEVSGTFAPGRAEGGVPRGMRAGPNQDGFRLVTGEIAWGGNPPVSAGFACIIDAARNQVVATHIQQKPLSGPPRGVGGSSPGADDNVPASLFQGCVQAARLKVQKDAGGRVNSITDPKLQRTGTRLLLGGSGVVGPARQPDGTTTPQRPFSYFCEVTGDSDQLGNVSFRLLPPERAPSGQ